MTREPLAAELIRKALEPGLFSLREIDFRGDGSKISFIPYPQGDGASRTAHHQPSHGDFPLGTFCCKDILLMGAHAIVATPDHHFLREQNAETILEQSIGISSRGAKEGNPLLSSAVSLVSAASYNFYHWIIDSLPKVIVAEACGFSGTYLVPPPGVNPIVLESLAILGIEENRIFPMEYEAVNVQELWIPTHYHGHLMEATPELHAAFRERMLLGASKISVPRKERLYIRRQASRKFRIIENADEVQALLSEFHFETFEMERMTLREQIALASQAACLIGPHGAGMLHSIWIPGGSKVIEILPITYASTVMAVHSRILKHSYVPLLVPSEGPEMRMTVDCAVLRGELERVLGKAS